jgi:hypothetical protein
MLPGTGTATTIEHRNQSGGITKCVTKTVLSVTGDHCPAKGSDII